MSFLQWNDSLDLGIDLIDGHHRHLVSLVNMAHQRMQEGCGCDVMTALLNELADYATYHFAAEEYWMLEYEYPHRQAHALEHENFSVKVVELELQFASGNHDILPELVSFLSTWLVEHIQKSDGAYGTYARSIGATHDHKHPFTPRVT